MIPVSDYHGEQNGQDQPDDDEDRQEDDVGAVGDAVTAVEAVPLCILRSFLL